MTEQPTALADRYAHLRANARRQKQTTVERLKQAIATLEAEHRPITVFTIKEISGLDYMAYYRNAEALTLFRRHSTHLQAAREKEQARRRTDRRKLRQSEESLQATVAPPRDPLLNYKKPGLVSLGRPSWAGTSRLRWNGCAGVRQIRSVPSIRQ